MPPDWMRWLRRHRPRLRRNHLPVKVLIPALLVLLLPLVNAGDCSKVTSTDGPQFKEWLEDQQGPQSSQLGGEP
jgi:hypothetical protein